MIKIMVADDSLEFTSMIVEYLNGLPDMQVVGVSLNGEDLLEQLIYTEDLPDILLLDIIMSRLDGLDVLERLPFIGLPAIPRIIVLTAFGQEQVVQTALELGASYFMLKPLNLEILSQRIRQEMGMWTVPAMEVMSANNPAQKTSSATDYTNRLDILVANVMNDIGISSYIRGYPYLKEAIIQIYQNREMLGAVTTLLYPAIAEKFDSTPSRVERAIRQSIDTTWTRNETRRIHQLFRKDQLDHNSKPTNSEFIAMIAEQLRIEYEYVFRE